MSELIVREPSSIECAKDLTKFVLVGQEKLIAVRAEIRAIQKIGLAQEVYQQKLAEGQDIAEAVLDAEIKLGELRAMLERAKTGPKELGLNDETKLGQFDAAIAPQATTDSGRKNAGNRLEQMASHPDVVERIKAEARERGELVTKTAVLKAIQAEKKDAELQAAKESIAQQVAKQSKVPIVHVGNGIGFEPEEDYDLLLTDPPYSTDVDDIDEFANSWLPNALNHVKPTGFAYVFIGAYPNELRAYLNIVPPEHMELCQVLVWSYRNTLGVTPKDRYDQSYQCCLFYRGKDAPALDCPLTAEKWAVMEVNAPGGITASATKDARYHAWQKPIELGERFVRHATRPDMTVFDPFCCTGTFLLAAAKLGRNAYGFELNPENAKIAQDRGCALAEDI